MRAPHQAINAARQTLPLETQEQRAQARGGEQGRGNGDGISHSAVDAENRTKSRDYQPTVSVD